MVKPHTSIVVCTLDRYDFLDRCLAHLAGQRTPPAYEVIVVDNSETEHGDPLVRRAVERAGAAAAGDFVYVHARGPNLSTARNAGLAAARGDFIAYVDDDLLMPPDWLAIVAGVLERTQADCILGRVEAELLPGADTPGLARFFLRSLDLADEAVIVPNHYGFTPSARTCNVVFRRATTFDRGLTFDPVFGRSGGEDTDIFVRLAAEPPFRVIYSEKALARELIPPERQTLAYLCRREFRGGQVFVRVLTKNARRFPAAAGLLQRVIGAAQCTVATVRSVLDPQAFEPRIKRASAAGKVFWRRPDLPGPYR